MREVLVLAAALSIPDPRERPADREEAARQKHARFADEHSDFLSYLNLWRYLRRAAKGALRQLRFGGCAARSSCTTCASGSGRTWPGSCAASPATSASASPRPEPADPARVHAALTGRAVVAHRPARGRLPRLSRARATPSSCSRPGSVLTKRPPRWIVVADLVETSRLYGRTAARIEPEAVERVAGASGAAHATASRTGTRKRGAVMAYERVTLYGLPLVPRRTRRLRADRPGAGPRPVHPARAGRGRLADPAPLLPRQRRGCAQSWRRWRSAPAAATCWSTTTRSSRFYDARIPPEVVSARHFDAWWKKQRHRTPDLLTFTRDDLLRTDDADADQPDTWQAGDLSLPLTYRFEPGAADDGVTVHVPVEVLARLGGDEFAWQVPALREELVTALIKSLPKDLRRNFVPAPDTARAVLDALDPGDRAAAGRSCSASCAGAPACWCRSTPST